MAVKFLDETFTHEGRQWRRITAEADERWVLSVDLGQAADFTAISLLHHRRSPLETFAEIRHPNGRGSLKQNVEEVIDVRHLERLKLHTPYPDQVAYVAELLARPPLNQTGCDLIIDASRSRTAGRGHARRRWRPPCRQGPHHRWCRGSAAWRE